MSSLRTLVLATGTKTGGGSGLRELLRNMSVGNLQTEIVGVACNHASGGLKAISDEYGLPFEYFVPPEHHVAESYAALVSRHRADFVALSGWLKRTEGLDPSRTFNIHPVPLSIRKPDGKPRFGGPGMYGHHIHEAVAAAGAPFSGPTMHFVTSNYDEGPSFFELHIALNKGESADSIGARVNKAEHGWQWWVTNLVVSGQISWSGRQSESVLVPGWYKSQPFCPATCQARD